MSTTRPSKLRHIPTAPIESSAISAVGHDPKTNTLRIEFSSGSVYDYPNISAKEHEALVTSDSPGSHFHKNIRKQEGKRVDA